MKKKYKCPYCGFALTGKENQCPNCRNTLTPAVAPDPERKKKALITLGIVLGSLLVLTILALWYFRVWPFRPRLDNAAITAEIGSPEDFLNLTEIPAPSDEQMAALSKYVEKLEVQQKHRLDITDRRGAKKIQILTAALSQDDPDIEQLIKDLGGKITYESGKTGETESKVPAVFLHLPQSPFSGTRLTGTTAVIGLPALFYSEADSDGDAESTDEEANPEGESEESVVPEDVETEGEGSDEGFVTTLPAEQLHSARIRVGLSKDILICPACRHENPKDAVVCEKCGAKLQSAPNYVETDPIEPEPQVTAGGGMSEEQREALMLSNLSNVLLMSNRSTLSFYMACLACEEDPQSVSAVVSLVTHLRMHGYLEEALDVCVIGLQMDPQREELYIHAGNIYIQLDNPDAALGYFNRCLTNCGFSGQAYQGMMAAYLQQNNYTEAFRCMIEGARDGYVSGIRLVYDMLKLRGDYWEIAGSVFKNYTVRTLMDFSVNRSGFNPGRELEGKVVDIGACDIPSSPEDWVASAESMLKSGQKYAQDMLVYYKEDIQEIAEIYNILLNAQDLKDLAAGFLKAFGDKYSKEKLTEAERVISYEQEIF
ncbi:MAG: zinc ribbon domain-containing protein [Lachnospiraceae bacterium]|nr:zinc ribbon domain-containing protein [Lachnospiraceae bacterium]